MTKAFVCSLCRSGILGGALYLDPQSLTYRTNKLTVDPRYRNLVLPLKDIESLSWKQIVFPVASFRMTDGELRFFGIVKEGAPYSGWISTGDGMRGKLKQNSTILYKDGGVYEGDILNGMRSGSGVYTYAYDHGTKDVYTGEFAENAFNGNGVLTYADGSIYTGSFKNGMRHGSGTLLYADGSKYVGEYQNGDMHGKGIMTYVDGSVYEGEFVGGVKHGKGKQVFAGGDTYEGEYQHGARNGEGTYFFAAEGQTYKGGFKDNQMHGEGTITWLSGRSITCSSSSVP